MSTAKFVLFGLRGGSRIAIRPGRVTGAEEAIDRRYTVLYYSRPGSRAVTVVGGLEKVLGLLGEVVDSYEGDPQLASPEQAPQTKRVRGRA